MDKKSKETFVNTIGVVIILAFIFLFFGLPFLRAASTVNLKCELDKNEGTYTGQTHCWEFWTSKSCTFGDMLTISNSSDADAKNVILKYNTDEDSRTVVIGNIKAHTTKQYSMGLRSSYYDKKLHYSVTLDNGSGCKGTHTVSSQYVSS